MASLRIRGGLPGEALHIISVSVMVLGGGVRYKNILLILYSCVVVIPY